MSDLQPQNEAWTNVTYQNGYATQNSQPAGYKKLPDGTVWLRGIVTAAGRTAGQQTMFTLPTAYRPTTALHFTASMYNGTGYVLGRVTADTSGIVYVRDASDATVGTNITWIFIDAVRFPTD